MRINHHQHKRRFAVYVTHEARVHSGTHWALYASTYASEGEALAAVGRALAAGYTHAELRISQLYSAEA